MQNRKKLSLAVILFIGFIITAVAQENPEITSDELQQHIGYLASDELEGRLPGTEGDRLAAEYIANEFQKAGIDLIAENGYQYFEVVTKSNYWKRFHSNVIF